MELSTTVPSCRKHSSNSQIHQNHIKSPWRQQGYWESADVEWQLSCWRGVSQVARRRLHPSLSWFYLYLPHFSFLKYFKLFFGYAAAAAAAKSLQSCPTLCDPIDRSPPGFLVPEILQARTLEWTAISFSNAWKWKVKVKSLRRVWLFVTPWTAAHQAPPPMGFSRQEYWSGGAIPFQFSSVHFSSVAQLCPTLCGPMNRSTPRLPVHYQLPEFTQTHIHRISDEIQPSHSVVPFSSCP